MKEVKLFDFKIQNNPTVSSQPAQTQLKLADILSLCYGLSTVDLQILKMIAKAGELTVDYLVDRTGLSKAGVNRSLNRLIQAGLVIRVKEAGNRKGRPRYLYRVKNTELKKKIAEDVRNCFDQVSVSLEKEFT